MYFELSMEKSEIFDGLRVLDECYRHTKLTNYLHMAIKTYTYIFNISKNILENEILEMVMSFSV